MEEYIIIFCAHSSVHVAGYCACEPWCVNRDKKTVDVQPYVVCVEHHQVSTPCGSPDTLPGEKPQGAEGLVLCGLAEG